MQRNPNGKGNAKEPTLRPTLVLRNNEEENAHNCLRASWEHPEEYPEDGMIIGTQFWRENFKYFWYDLVMFMTTYFAKLFLIFLIWCILKEPTLQVVPVWHLDGASQLEGSQSGSGKPIPIAKKANSPKRPPNSPKRRRSEGDEQRKMPEMLSSVFGCTLSWSPAKTRRWRRWQENLSSKNFWIGPHMLRGGAEIGLHFGLPCSHSQASGGSCVWRCWSEGLWEYCGFWPTTVVQRQGVQCTLGQPLKA